MYIESHQPLFKPIRLGDLKLPNRVVMAPLTRMRAANEELAPSLVHADYYAQRASAGLIISEGIFVSPEAVGWADVPGLWSDAQVRGWRVVTDAVHRAGGRIVAQLWHTGSLGHPDFHAGNAPLSASAVNPTQQSVTATGKKDTVVPRPMDKDDIRRTVADFGRAARNAIAAGFDGVQIQGGYHYLFNQFLNIRTNCARTSMVARRRIGRVSCSRSWRRWSRQSAHTVPESRQARRRPKRERSSPLARRLPPPNT